MQGLKYKNYLNLNSASYRDTVLVVGDQGGTALACVDIAQSVFKCKVIFASTTDAKCDVARQMGASSLCDVKASRRHFYSQSQACSEQ